MSKDDIQTIQAYPGSALTVVDGYNLGAALSFALELTLDDIYALSRSAEPSSLNVIPESDRTFRLIKHKHEEDDPETRQDNWLYFDSVITLMSSQAEVVDVIVMVEATPENELVEIFFMPLAQMEPAKGYTLIGVSEDEPQSRFGQIAMVAFARGTRITMSNGEQRPIELLQPGDTVLTRSDGVQELRWIGNSTLRAIGDSAPVRIRAGVLNNHNDLVLSPDHRLFIYQRSDRLRIGRREVLVRARHLIDGKTVVQEPGGFVDYYQLLFDHHQLIFAEGIAAETLQLNSRTRYALPEAVRDLQHVSQEGHTQRRHLRFEVDPTLTNSLNIADLLRHSSQ